MECAQSLLKALMRNAAMPAAKHEINRSWRFETETPTETMLDQINFLEINLCKVITFGHLSFSGCLFLEARHTSCCGTTLNRPV